MAEVPNLLEDGAVVATAKVRDRAGLSLEGPLDLGKRVGRLVGREDARATSKEA